MSPEQEQTPTIPQDGPQPAPRRWGPLWVIVAASLVVGIGVIAAGYFYLQSQTGHGNSFIDFSGLFASSTPSAISPQPNTAATSTSSRLQYLGFYAITAGPLIIGQQHIDSKSDMEQHIDSIVSAIGQKGDHVHTQLGVWAGPMGWDLSDARQKQFIDDAFAVAEEKSVAIGFHIDDSMFWNLRKTLWSVHSNVEWSDWSGTTIPHRIIGWVGNSSPVLAPPMCFNSAAIEAEARRIATDVIGAEIRKNVDRLNAEGKGYLFMGVIAGWETRLQDDSQNPRVEEGYCALTNLGYSAGKPPSDKTAVLTGVVHSWVSLWTKALYDAGIPKNKIFTHIAYNAAASAADQAAQDSPPSVAFTDYSNPGFSLYGDSYPSALATLLSQHGNPAWGVSEGTAVGLRNAYSGGTAGVSGMEEYLAGVFNHGGVYVDIFGWNTSSTPPPDSADQTFANTTGSASAIAAYQKFLSGKALTYTPSSGSGSAQTDAGGLPTKMQKIQSNLSAYVQAHPSAQTKLTDLMAQLNTYIQANDFTNANKTADQVLSIIGQ